MKTVVNALLQALCAALLATLIPNLLWSIGAKKLTWLSLVWHVCIIANAVLGLMIANKIMPQHKEAIKTATVILTVLVTILTGISNSQIALFTSAQ